MRSILLSQRLVAFVDAGDHQHLAQHKWFAVKRRRNFYAVRNSPYAEGKRRHLLMHRFVIDCPSGMEIDHINGNGLDNRRINLRLATHAQNQQNCRPQLMCVSRFKGVSWSQQRRKWRARITMAAQLRELGFFDSEEEAAFAYDAKAREAFGIFARCNFDE